MATKVSDFNFKEEVSEEVMHHKMSTNWPAPLMEKNIRVPMRWRVVYEAYNQSIEDFYFRAMDYLQEEEAFPIFDKVTDLFAASEQSAFFGAAQQRLGLQQDKVSQFLATIGKMVKELFQLVRELRILDERLQIYYESYKGDLPAEITLKGYWIDLVEGGAKNPASVYGMARELGFVTLPDLFFGTPPMGSAQVDKYVNSLEFNRKVLEVLMRKLKSYLIWKEQTYKELKSRRTFTLKYLRQHYDIVKMYMNWVKPYLRNIERLSMDQGKMLSPNLISAFEGSMIEIEVLAKRPIEAGGHGGHGGPACYAIYSLHFDYRTRPEMKYMQEGYQRGPSHIGRMIFTLRAYAWTQAELNKYKEFRAREDFDMLASIDASVKAAYSSLGEDLEKYLRESGEELLPEFAKEKKSEKKRKLNLFEPFKAIFKSPAAMHAEEHGGHKEEHKCPKCKMKLGHGPWCEHCGHELRKLTRAEAMNLEDARAEAEEYCKKHFYNFQKRYKAAYGFIY
ncbi:hypothetical protein HY488_01260 [Candidatus Woesearchaeota archaeon]|nr:hypothetical protein [Candidatus Woesearchaeota archaeon]